jgi:hypothetical protein
MLKVKFSLCATCKHAGGAEVYFLPPFIVNLASRWTWVVCLTSLPLYLRERGAGTRWIRGWVVPGAVLEVLQQSILLTPAGFGTADRTARSLFTILPALYRLEYHGRTQPQTTEPSCMMVWPHCRVRTRLNHPRHAWVSGAKEVKEGTSDRRNFIHQHCSYMSTSLNARITVRVNRSVFEQRALLCTERERERCTVRDSCMRPQAPGKCMGIAWKDKQKGHALHCENEWTYSVI